MIGGEKMKIYKSFVTRCYTTPEQEIYLQKCFGVARYIYNICVNKYLESKEKKKYLNKTELYDIVKKEIKDKEWLSDVNRSVIDNALRDFYNKKEQFWTKIKNGEESSFHYRSKKEFNSCEYHRKKHNTFQIINKNNISILKKREPGKKFAPRFILKTRENLNRFNENGNRIQRVCIFKKNGIYYINLVYETKTKFQNINTNNKLKVGIDMGIKTSMTLFDSNNDIKEYKIPLKKLRRQNRKVNKKNCFLLRKKYGSKGYLKALSKFHKAQTRFNNMKKDWIEKTTSEIVNKYDEIIIEPYDFSLNKTKVKYKAGRISRIEVSGYTILKRLKDKANLNNKKLFEVPKYRKTTQRCSCCGNILEGSDKLKIYNREYKCKICGNIMDRDVNAAKNILNYFEWN